MLRQILCIRKINDSEFINETSKNKHSEWSYQLFFKRQGYQNSKIPPTYMCFWRAIRIPIHCSVLYSLYLPIKDGVPLLYPNAISLQFPTLITFFNWLFTLFSIFSLCHGNFVMSHSYIRFSLFQQLLPKHVELFTNFLSLDFLVSPCLS